MKTQSIALITIGQSPRPDLRAAIDAAIPAGANVLEAGILDGLSQTQIESDLLPCPGEMPLITKLRDGSVIVLSSDKAQKMMQTLVNRLSDKGIDIIILLCTGQFSGLDNSTALVVQPDLLVPSVLAAMVPNARLGVVMPKAEQAANGPDKWIATGLNPVYAAAPPYNGSAQDWRTAGQQLATAGVKAVILDCMGYDESHAEMLQSVLTCPIFTSGKIIAGVLSSLL